MEARGPLFAVVVQYGTAASTPRSWTKRSRAGPLGGVPHVELRAESRTTSGRRSGQRCRSDLQPPRDRQQGRARDAGHPRGPRAERLAGGADPAHRSTRSQSFTPPGPLSADESPFARLAHVRRPGRRRPKGATWITGRSSARSPRPGPTRPGSTGGSWPSTGVRRALREARGDLHQAERGDDAADRRQDRGQAAESVGVPVAPWSKGPVESEEARRPPAEIDAIR